jgi:hypothetical protein
MAPMAICSRCARGGSDLLRGAVLFSVSSVFFLHALCVKVHLLLRILPAITGLFTWPRPNSNVWPNHWQNLPNLRYTLGG